MHDSVRKNIDNILRKYDFDSDHARQVTKLSLLIFDKTRDFLHRLGDSERDLLEAGTLLHDIGYSISATKHNKHSYDLIIENGIAGYNSKELEIVANIAKYHRGKKPKNSHECYSKLSDKNSRELVRKLAAIAKLADGLDRSHLNVVENLECVFDSFSATLYIVIKLNIPDCGPEIWAADKKKDLFEEEFGVRVVIRCS